MVEKPQWLKGPLVGLLEDRLVETRLEKLVELVLKAPFNITGFRTAEALWIHGVYDAIETLQGVNLTGMKIAVDIGSGAGFPGLVLAILTAETSWTLIESREKRAEYLKYMVEDLDLGNVSVLHGRAEEIVRNETGIRECADLVTARAVGSFRVTLELAVPYMKVGGSGFFPRGRVHVMSEIEEAQDLCRELGAEVGSVSPPYGDNGESQIIRVTKMQSTSLEFPRRAKLLGTRLPG